MLLRRREWLGALGATLAGPVAAQFRVEISGVGATQLPVAIGRFRDEAQSPQPVSAIIKADLERSGAFRVVDTPEGLDETSSPSLSEWKGRGADALVLGSASKLADGRYDVRFRLWDIVKGVDLGGQSFPVLAADLRLAAHRVADVIYEKLTGEKGVFSTRIAYVAKGGNRYTLRIADADGEADKIALTSPDPIISPAWSPDGREVAYVSFQTQKAVVWIQNLVTGTQRQVANFRGSNSAPAFAPSGQELAATLSREGSSQLYMIGRDGGEPRRLTRSSAIDTEPVFTTDGSQIYFVSDRGGSPQIYRMAAGGGNAERVTFSGSYNISPAISPDGKMLAYVTRQNGAFKLVVMDLGSGTVTPLTDTSDDESPSFAPNGRLIIYATRAGGKDLLMTTTLDGRIKARLLASGLDVREPAWGPYGR
jgi:TolB protein